MRAQVSASVPRLDRRRFLLGVTAAGVLAACGSSEESESPTTTAATAAELSAAMFFGPYYLAGEPARVPIGLADAEGLLPVDASPAQITVRVADPTGAVVVDDLRASLFSAGLPRPYYAFEFVPEEPGFYDVTIDTGSGTVMTQVPVVPSDDPVVAKMVRVGQPMPALVTPTVGDAAGVDPVCTRSPACNLHDHTVAEVLAEARPFVLLVSTPAFCQTAICGPVLDVLLDALEGRGLAAIHAEVYRDPENNQVPPVPEDFAPVVGDLGLLFEPVLYAVGADGVVTGRLDYVFGREEVVEFLDRISA